MNHPKGPVISDFCRGKVRRDIGDSGIYVPAEGDGPTMIADKLGVHHGVIEAMIRDNQIDIGEPEPDHIQYEHKGAYGGPGGMVRHVTVSRSQASAVQTA